MLCPRSLMSMYRKGKTRMYASNTATTTMVKRSKCLALTLVLLWLLPPAHAVKDGTAVDRAKPKKGKTVAPPLSEAPSAAFTALPKFGTITWEVGELPWVGEGPDEGVSGMGLVAHDGKLLLCGGFIPGGDGSTGTASRRTSRWTWCYDPKDGAWARLADAPFRREYVRSIATEDAVYMLGGGCQYKGQAPPYRVHGDCARLDLVKQPSTWQAHSPLNVPRTHSAVGLAGDCLVVAGGNEYDFRQNGYSHATIRDTCEVFDPAQPDKGWQVRTPIPGPGRGWAASVAADEYLYLFGGLTWTESDAPVGTRETLCYDPKADAWKRLAPPPLAISGWEGALYADRYAILAGGVERRSGGIVWSDLVWVYDVEEDRWLRIDDVLPPGAVFNDPGVAVIDDTIYVAGAEGPHGSHYNYFLAGRIHGEQSQRPARGARRQTPADHPGGG